MYIGRNDAYAGTKEISAVKFTNFQDKYFLYKPTLTYWHFSSIWSISFVEWCIRCVSLWSSSLTDKILGNGDWEPFCRRSLNTYPLLLWVAPRIWDLVLWIYTKSYLENLILICTGLI